MTGGKNLESCRVCERRARRSAGFRGSACWRPLKGRDEGYLRGRLKTLAEQYQRYGYPMLHAMLKSEGLVIAQAKLPDVPRGMAAGADYEAQQAHLAQVADGGTRPSERALADGFPQ